MNSIVNRTYKIWAYTVSHNFLILRSPMAFKDVEGYSEYNSFNVDIEFTAVVYLDLPSIIHGIAIKECTENIPEKFKHYCEGTGNKLFEILSEGKFYYIVAGGYRIGKNTWIAEDRISNLSLEYDEILATS